MAAILQFKLTPVVFRDVVLRGKRYASQEALQVGMVDAIASEEQVLPKAKELALQLAPLAKAASVAYKQLKDQVKQQRDKGYMDIALMTTFCGCRCMWTLSKDCRCLITAWLPAYSLVS